MPFQTSTRANPRQATPSTPIRGLAPTVVRATTPNPNIRQTAPLTPSRALAPTIIRPTTPNPNTPTKATSQRLNFQLPNQATATGRVKSPPPQLTMGDPALIAAITQFTQQVHDDRRDALRQTNQLIGALNQQHQQNNVLVGLLQAQQQQLVPPAGAGGAAAPPQLPPRISSMAVESIPQFEGSLKDFPQDFVDFVDRVAVAENWNDVQRIQVASRRLLRTALDWHTHTGHTHANWADWSAAFVLNFSPRLHFSEWHRLVVERRQEPNESGIEYALDKNKLLRVSPIPLNDEQRVSFLIDGLAKWQHVAAMTANVPANVTAFIQRIRALETLGVTSRPDQQPPHSPHFPATLPAPDLSATLAAFGEKLAEEISSRLNVSQTDARGGYARGGYDRGGYGRGGYSRGGSNRGGFGRGRGGGWVDPSSRSCYNCGVVGHISRDCPSKAGKGPAGQ